ncbi:MAG: HAD family hydrolase [Pirellulaceae bacterium]
MTIPTAIVFDLDQTLFDRQQACDRWIASLDVSPSDRLRLRELDHNGHGSRPEFFAAAEVATGQAIDQKQFVLSLIRYVSLDPKLKLALQTLRQSYVLAILTNGGVASQKAKLRALSLDELFDSDRIFISDQIGFAKPDRRAFIFVSEALGLTAKECLYFGDQFGTDIVAARSAGWMASQVSGPAGLHRQLNGIIEVSA